MMQANPPVVLERFARFVSDEVQPTVRDDQILYQQVGSLANSLHFLAAEIRDKSGRINEQRRRLLAALEEVTAAVEASGTTAPLFEETVTQVRNRVEELEPDMDPYEQERALLAATDEVLEAAYQRLDGEAVHAARRPMHEYLRQWTQMRLSALGREDGSDE